jgi:hypothetical protein
MVLVVVDPAPKMTSEAIRVVVAVRSAMAVIDEDADVAVPNFGFICNNIATAASGSGDAVSVVNSVVDAAPPSVVAKTRSSGPNGIKLFASAIYECPK